MKILREYVWDTFRQNKRSCLVVMIALFLMTSLMSCFCGLVYTMWTDAVALEKWHNGNWHGELFDDTPGNALEKIRNYASVSAVMIKGKWETAKLPDASGTPDTSATSTDNSSTITNRRLYLVFRGANQEYWDSMPEKHNITEGRLPSSETEIILSKQYFEDYPETKIGDSLTLPVGQRIYNGEVCMDTDLFHEGETFQETDIKTYTIVGIMDVTTSSAVPAYTGMTGLDEDSIQDDDRLTVYLRFDPMRGAYRELPSLAASIGYEPNEYDQYQLRYNSGLLSTYGIFDPALKGLPFHLSNLAVPLLFLTFATLLVGVFVLVIHNAFIISVNEKLTQLGTLAGVGATPKQINKIIQSEALLLTALPLPFGIFTGWALVIRLFQLINASNNIGREAPDIIVTFGLPAILPAVCLSLLTTWLSARIPAKKAAKMLPVEILKQEGEFNKKHKRNRIHFPGITGELASNAVSARSRSYRTATISLCMSFLLLMIFQYIATVRDANDAIFRSDPSEDGHIFLSVSDGRPPDMEALEQTAQAPGVTKAVIYDSLPCAIWIEPEDVSSDINTYLGGMDEIIAKKKYSPIERDGKYRIQSVVYGLETNSFRDYCTKLGISPQTYFDDPSKALAYNYTKDPLNSTRRNVLSRELLNIREGQSLTFTEKNTDDAQGDFEFTVTAETLVDELPIEELESSNFTLTLVMPMEHVLKLGESCADRRWNASRVVTGTFWTELTDSVESSAKNPGSSEPDYSAIQETSKRMDKILSTYYGSGDYLLSDLAERTEMTESSQHVFNLVITFLTAFLAVIGLSNVWSSISGNLHHRRQEFAMLKSVGLSPRQLWKLLLLEGLTLGLKPLLYSLPIQIAALGAFLMISEISVIEYLPFAPYGIIFGYTGLILLAIIGAYVIGGHRLQHDNIIDMLRDDTL